MMKNIKELTDNEAKQILKFVYPNKGYDFTRISFEPKLNQDGQQVTFGMRPIIGIEYYNGQDNCILHFDNTKVVLWLYGNGYDITELLVHNQHFSDMEQDFDGFSSEIYCLSKGDEMFAEDVKHNYTLEYVKNKCTELLERYCYKDY